MELTGFVQSPNRNAGRVRPLRLIVWHTMETPEDAGRAENIARHWFGSPSARASAHVCIDNREVWGTVRARDTAWAAPGANADGYQIELAGRAAQNAAGWSDPYSVAMLELAARWVAGVPELAEIPDRWLSDADIRAGAAGHCTHAQISNVYRRSDHWDPGPHFPKARVMALIRAARAPEPEPEPPTLLERLSAMKIRNPLTGDHWDAATALWSIWHYSINAYRTALEARELARHAAGDLTPAELAAIEERARRAVAAELDAREDTSDA